MRREGCGMDQTPRRTRTPETNILVLQQIQPDNQLKLASPQPKKIECFSAVGKQGHCDTAGVGVEWWPTSIQPQCQRLGGRVIRGFNEEVEVSAPCGGIHGDHSSVLGEIHIWLLRQAYSVCLLLLPICILSKYSPSSISTPFQRLRCGHKVEGKGENHQDWN